MMRFVVVLHLLRFGSDCFCQRVWVYQAPACIYTSQKFGFISVHVRARVSWEDMDHGHRQDTNRRTPRYTTDLDVERNHTRNPHPHHSMLDRFREGL